MALMEGNNFFFIYQL